MRNPSQDERAALALATASVIGDKRAAKRHHCAERTLRDWRQRCETDEDLAAACLRARARLDGEWRKDVPKALMSAVAFIQEAGELGDPKDAAMVESISKSVERLTNSLFTMKLLDERLNARAMEQARATGTRLVEAAPPAATGTDG